MSLVQPGDRIAIHYRVQGLDGEVLAASPKGQPLPLRVGSVEVIPGLSLGVVGMRLGETRELRVAPEQAFGARRPAIERSIAKDKLPAELVVGDRLRLTLGPRQLSLWIVGEQWGTTWRVTTQHPLVGRQLDIVVKVVAHQP